VEAIEDGDRDELREELGDVLLQVVFHARIAEAAEEPPPAPSDGTGPPVHGLPTRVRQASLAAPLRDAPTTDPEGSEREVSAEEMRSIFGAFQRGLDRGRKGDTVGSESAGSAPRPRTTDEGTADDG
ncbi:MazG nucleotide pyrophosphohydrolase domain-containing protein, partial [Streptomyces sp. NPDC023998]|uniref:MazG nucleotide pyrophosphohydrolase domain-containing protein n=1 Tax=Streptomyces sp. NPDC023998 TaxID=3154597 RepID=UPI0033D4369B